VSKPWTVSYQLPELRLRRIAATLLSFSGDLLVLDATDGTLKKMKLMVEG
jgi:hypothetical protein